MITARDAVWFTALCLVVGAAGWLVRWALNGEIEIGRLTN